jgi:Domain of unknown function (DUF3854)
MYPSKNTPQATLVSHAGQDLAERHRRELTEGSGLSETVIAERGYRTVTDVVELLRLGFADYQCRPGLLIPLHGTHGANDRYALKPDHPRQEHREGKADRPIKYEYPSGQAPMIDVPPRCLAQLDDPTVPLVFSEGSKKVDCAASLGYCAVDLWGVHNWYRNPDHGGFATIEPLPDWDRILPTLDGRICYLAFDSDAFTKPSVGLALRRLANFLGRHGALVYIVQLPDAPSGAKLGLDDFVVLYGAEAFAQCLTDAEPHGSVGMVRHLQQRVRELEQQLSAQAEVLRNPALTPTQKTVAIATGSEDGWHANRGEPTPYRVNATRVGEAAGVSPQTASGAIKVLADPDRGLFEKRVTRTLTDEGQWRSTMELKPRCDGGVLGLLKATATYAPERPAWGGKRFLHCPDHPEADVVKRCTSACIKCGQVIGEPTVTILKCQDDHSAADESATEAPGRLNGQVDSSARGTLSRDNYARIVSPLRTTSDQVDRSAPAVAAWSREKADRMRQRAEQTIEGEYPSGCPLDGDDLNRAEQAVDEACRAQDLVELRRALEHWVGLHRAHFAAYQLPAS